jgi:vitamin B12 transporter
MKNVKILYAVFAASPAFALPQLAFAQDAASLDETESENPIIIDEGRAFMDGTTTITVIGSKLDAGQSNASVSLIREPDLSRAQNGAISEVLQRLPGVTVTRNGTLGSFTGVRIRGADAEQTLVVIDGVRVGDPTSPGGGFDFGSLLIGNIDTIEVLRGANSVPWGSQAIGGVVNITTTRPSANANDTTMGRIVAEYGANATRRINGTLRSYDLPLGSFGFGVGYTKTDGISSAANGTERDGFRQYSANFNSRSQISEGLSLKTFGLFADSRLALDGFAPPTFAFGDTNDYQKSREHYGAASIEYDLGGNADQLKLNQKFSFSIADINRDSLNPAFGTAPDFRARGRTERLSYTLNLQPLGGQYGGWQTTDLLISAGAEREWSRSFTADSFSQDRGKTSTNAAFAQVVGRPIAAVSLTAGIRYEDHQNFGKNFSVSADAGVALGNGWRARASYREGFKAPTLFQLSGSAGGFGNPALQPEDAKAYEIGLGGGSSGIWGVDFALFRRDSRNLIDFVSCPPGPNPQPAICASGNRFFGTYDNIRSARAQGVEVDVFYALNSNLTLDANYSFVAAKDRTVGSTLIGNRLARRPAHSGNVELRWSGDKGLTGAEASATLRYVGSSFDNRANSVRLTDYVLVDLRASYEIDRLLSVDANLTGFVRVENLFDAQYQNVAGYGTYGRSVYAGVGWNF